MQTLIASQQVSPPLEDKLRSSPLSRRLYCPLGLSLLCSVSVMNSTHLVSRFSKHPGHVSSMGPLHALPTLLKDSPQIPTGFLLRLPLGFYSRVTSFHSFLCLISPHTVFKRPLYFSSSSCPLSFLLTRCDTSRGLLWPPWLMGLSGSPKRACAVQHTLPQREGRRTYKLISAAPHSCPPHFRPSSQGREKSTIGGTWGNGSG